MIDKQIEKISMEIAIKSAKEAECYPIDRFFLEKYMNDILSLNTRDFIFYNFEIANPTYSVQLMLCLPELWKRITLDDIVDIVNKFSNIFSYYAIIEFTYKYIEINIIELILYQTEISVDVKRKIKNFLINSFYPNLLKSDTDIFFIKEGLYGINYNDWMYIKQCFLLDNRAKEALDSVKELFIYLNKLMINGVNSNNPRSS